MKDRIQKRTQKLTLCAMLCALGVILMAIGALIEVLDLSTAALASLLCVFAVIELGRGYPWAVWAITSLLSLLLLPQKTPALFYTVFLGYYPILKSYLERFPRWISVLGKFVGFHIALILILAGLRLFGLSAQEDPLRIGFGIALYGLALICFWIYDLALTKLITAYLFRFQTKFRRKFRF